MTVPDTMRAMVVAGEGDTSRLIPGRVPRPILAAGQVLVRVVAASVNRPDVQQRRGLYPPPPEASPLLGLDVSGIVVETADDVAWPRSGDRVCALVNGGAYAEYCTVPAGQCLPLPETFGFVESASLPEVFFTAWNAVMLLGRLESAERLLIQGGSSGVGLAMIQIATQLCDARVAVTASSQEKRDLCLAYGAAHATDYRDPDWMAQVRGWFGGGCDVIVDAQAGPTTQAQMDLLDTSGRLVLLAGHAGPIGEVDTRQIVRRRLTLTGSTLRPRTAAFKAGIAAALKTHVWPLIAEGKVKTHICGTFPLEQATEAHALLEANKQIGKIVLIVAPDEIAAS